MEGNWSRENVRLGTRPDPHPGPGQVRLRMTASALNYRDLLVPQRGYGSRMQELPLVMLSDGVGVADAIGEGVTAVKEGDRLCPLFFQSWIAGDPNEDRLSRSLGVETDGTMGEFMVLGAAGVVAAPSHLSDEEAASLPTAGVTAWRALVTEGRLKAGDTVLVQGTGGVSLFALQFAKLLGAFVIVTSSSDGKLERARGLGADAVINYRTTPGWGKRAREITAGVGVDHVVEVGGQGTLPESLRAVRPGGTISMIGVLAGGTMDARLGLVVTRHVRLQGITVGNRDDFAAMARESDRLSYARSSIGCSPSTNCIRRWITSRAANTSARSASGIDTAREKRGARGPVASRCRNASDDHPRPFRSASIAPPLSLGEASSASA